MKIIPSMGLILCASLGTTEPSYSQVVSVATIPPETIKTSTYYDSASHNLTVACHVATRGWCYFFVADEARAKGFVLRPKTRSVIAGVSDKARVCAVGRNPGAACNLTPVLN